MLRWRSGVLLAPTRLPYILFASPADPPSTEVRPDDAKKSYMKSLVSSLRKSKFSASKTTPKRVVREKKSDGLNAVLSWCACYQHNTKRCYNWDSLQLVNNAALEWIGSGAAYFTCGQKLVLLSLMCDVLHRVLAGNRYTAADDNAQSFAVELHDEVVELLQGICSGDSTSQLDAQPLAILATGLYGVYKVQQEIRRATAAGDAGSKQKANMLAALEEPFGVLHRCFILRVHQAATAAESEASSLQSLATKNKPVAIRLLLTFLLCADNATRTEVLHSNAASCMRSVSQLLWALLQPQILLRENNRFSLDYQGSDEADTNLQSERLTTSAPAEGSEEAPRGDLTAVLRSPDTSDILGSQHYLEDCSIILHNASTCRFILRMCLMEYLLLRVRAPESYTVEELEQVPVVLAAVKGPLSQYRHNIILELVKKTSLMDFSSRPLRLFVQLLPHLYVPHDVIATSGLASLPDGTLRKGCELIPAADSSQILCAVAAYLPSPVVQQLQTNVLHRYAPQALQLSASSTSPAALPSQSIPLCVPLLITMYHHHLTTQGEEREGSIVKLAQLLPAIEWKAGVVGDVVRESEPVEAEQLDVQKVLSTAFDFHSMIAALELYVLYCESTPPADAVLVDEKNLWFKYLRPLLLLGSEEASSQHKVPAILRIVLRSIPFLSSPSYAHRLIDRLIRFNSLTSPNVLLGVVRFLDELSSAALQYSVVSSTAVTALLDFGKVPSLHPLRYSPRSRFGSGKEAVIAEFRCYTKSMLAATRYLLMVVSSAEKLPDLTRENASKQLTSWFEDYFRALAAAQARLRELREQKTENAEKESTSPPDDQEGTSAANKEEEEEDPIAPPEALGDYETEAQEEAEGEPLSTAPSEPHLSSLDSDRNLLVTESEVETLFTVGVSVGVHLSSLILRQTVQPRVDAYEDAMRLPNAVLDSAALPMAAHFVYFVRSGRRFSLQLNTSMLSHWLKECDFRIFHLVMSSYIIASTERPQIIQHTRRRPSQPSPLSLESSGDLWTALHLSVMELHLRLTSEEGVSDGVKNIVVLNALRVIVQQVDRLSAVAPRSVSQAHNNEEEEGADSPGAEKTHLKVLEADIMPCLSCVSQSTAQSICLTFLDKLYASFPSIAAEVFLRLKGEGEEHLGDSAKLGVKELLLLCASYPPAEPEVLLELGKRDLSTLDFGDYLHHAAKLPLPVTRMVVTAHLPSLSFAWCSRLLTSISHMELEDDFLSAILSRVESLIPTASASDRNLFLAMLTSTYLPRSTILGKESSTTATASDPSIPTACNLQSGASRLLQCYDALVNVDSVVCVDTLRALIHLVPSPLETRVVSPLIKRIEDCVLPSLLCRLDLSGAAPPEDFVAGVERVVSLSRLLLHEHLVSHGIRQQIFQTVFQSSRIPPSVSAAKETGSPDQASSIPEAHPSPPSSFPAAAIPHLVELALLLGRDHDVSEEGDGSRSEPLSEAYLTRCLECLQEGCASADHRLMTLESAVEQTTLSNASTSSNVIMLQIKGTKHVRFPSHVLDAVILRLVKQSNELPAPRLVKLIMLISKLKRWSLVPRDETPASSFHTGLQQMFVEADAHTQCVLLRAISTDPGLLHWYEPFMVRHIIAAISLLSYEDLELLLTTLLQMRSLQLIELMLDAIGTRVMATLSECKPTVFIRLLQCHAVFQMKDEQLLLKVLREMDSQCHQRGVMRLTVVQITHFLQAVVALDMKAPARLLMACFSRVEKVVETIPPHQIVSLARLAVEVEMAYSPAIHALVTALPDAKSGYRVSREAKDTIELLCSVYDVEVPYHWRHTKLRDHKKQMRQREVKFRLRHPPDEISVEI